MTSVTHYAAAPIGVRASSFDPMMEMDSMPLIAPIFVEDVETSSSLVLVNASSINAGATISIRTLPGAERVHLHVILAPHEQRRYSVRSLLAGSVATLGSITVTQDAGLKGMAVAAQLLITNNRGSVPSYIDEELIMPRMDGSLLLRAVSDPSIAAPLLAIANVSDDSQHVTVQCLEENGPPQRMTLTLAARATSVSAGCSAAPIGTLQSYLDNVPDNNQPAVQGIEIEGDGAPGSLAAFAVAPHRREGSIVLSSVPFTDPGMVYSSSIVFAGVPIGTQSTLPDGTYVPQLAFTNFAATPPHITISQADTPQGYTTSSTGPGNPLAMQVVRQLTLSPRQSTSFVLNGAASQTGLLHSFVVTSDKQPGEVWSKLVSRGNGNLYQVEELAKDASDPNADGGIHPWLTEGDFESQLLLFNHSSAPRVVNVEFSNGVMTWNKDYTVAPSQTMEISVNELVRDKVKDDNGIVLAQKYKSGVVSWMTPDSGYVSGRLLVSSKAKTLARNFSCGQYVALCGMDFTTYLDGLVPGGNFTDPYLPNPAFCLELGPNTCDPIAPPTGGTASYVWSISPTSIVKLNTPADKTKQAANLFGVSAGTGDAIVEAHAGNCEAPGNGTPNVHACPTSITVNKLNQVPITIDSTLHTGYGVLASMTTNPTSLNWSAAVITESITSKSYTCESPIGNALPDDSGGPFAVGASAAPFDNPLDIYPPIYDAFYDEHSYYAQSNLLALTVPRQSNCVAVLTQSYRCGGKAIGNFTITETFTLGTANGGAATIVSVNKQ